jgi:carboxyl-terminal processing protease
MGTRTLGWLVLFGLVLALALRLHGQMQAAAQDTLAREQATYLRLREIILRKYVREVDERKLFYSAMDGMASGLDPHSRFLPPELYDALRVSTTGRFEGVGLELNPDESLGLVVLTPLLGTPAFRSGVFPGDRIVKIDGVSAEGMNREEATRRIRGPVGTKVRLTLLRQGQTQPVEVELERAVNEIPAVPTAMLLDTSLVPAGKPAVGYVELPQFQQRSAQELSAALDRLETQGMQALIMDLRGNPGGVLDAAEQVADLFLRDGVIVSVTMREQDGGEAAARVRYAEAGGTHPDYPIVVLVDGHSASASEIVSGALKDRGRAVLVGEKTYGKFTVQDIFGVPLGNWGEGALKLTIAHYKTPAEPCVDGQGIVPDHVVPFTPDQQRGLQLARMQRHLRQNDPRQPRLKKEVASPMGSFKDIQLQKAVEVLLQQLQAAKE